MNVVMNSGGAFVEVQGTAEGHAFRRHELDAAAEPRAQRHRRAAARRPGTAALRAVRAAAGPRHRQPGQAARVRGAARPAAVRAGAAVDARHRRGRRRPARAFEDNALLKARHAAAPAAPRPSPTTPASRSMRSVGARASTRRASPAAGAEMPPTTPSCSLRWPACRTSAQRALPLRAGARRTAERIRRRSSPRAAGKAHRDSRRAAAAALATTRFSGCRVEA